MLEDLLRDLGVLITDMFADSYLLAVGFSDHFRRMGTFLFEQFLRLEETAEPESLSAFKLTVSLFARLLAMAIAKNRRASCISSDVPIAQSELRQARGDVTHFLTHAVYHPRFASLLTERRKRVRITVRDVVVEREAIRLVTMAERAIRMASDFSARFTGPASLSKADPPNAAAIERGEVTEIERTRITDYFGRLLDIEDSDERLFRARAALVASVLISCEPRRRLAHFRED
jgi:hypothetical protein